MQNPRIDGIDWRSLQKGDIIPKEHILDYWNIFFPDKEWDRFSMLEVKENVMKLREGINKPIVLKEVKESLVVLTDKDAVDYSAKQANAGIKKHRKHTRRMFTHIDTNNLDEAKKRDLETKQITHASFQLFLMSFLVLLRLITQINRSHFTIKSVLTSL